MNATLRRKTGLLGSGAMAVATVALSAPAAHANPDWTLWNEGTNAALTSAEVIPATGTVVFGATLAGSPHNVTCTFGSGNPVTVGATGPTSAAPGGSLSLDVSLPSLTVCHNQAGLDIPLTITKAWTQSLVMPAAGTTSGQLFDGPLSGTLTIPANSMTIDFGVFRPNCAASGPTVARSVSSSYDSRAGSLTPTAILALPMTTPPDGCTITSVRLSSAALTLSPVVDLRW